MDGTHACSQRLNQFRAGVAFYFIIFIIGGFFVVNLFLAVLFEEFVTAEAAEKEGC